MTEFVIVACGAFLIFALFLGVMAVKARRQSSSRRAPEGCGRAACQCRREEGTVQIAADPQALLSSSKRQRR